LFLCVLFCYSFVLALFVYEELSEDQEFRIDRPPGIIKTHFLPITCHCARIASWKVSNGIVSERSGVNDNTTTASHATWDDMFSTARSNEILGGAGT